MAGARAKRPEGKSGKKEVLRTGAHIGLAARADANECDARLKLLTCDLAIMDPEPLAPGRPPFVLSQLVMTESSAQNIHDQRLVILVLASRHLVTVGCKTSSRHGASCRYGARAYLAPQRPPSSSSASSEQLGVMTAGRSSPFSDFFALGLLCLH